MQMYGYIGTVTAQYRHTHIYVCMEVVLLSLDMNKAVGFKKVWSILNLVKGLLCRIFCNPAA